MLNLQQQTVTVTVYYYIISTSSRLGDNFGMVCPHISIHLTIDSFYWKLKMYLILQDISTQTVVYRHCI